MEPQERMLDVITRQFRRTRSSTGRAAPDPRVIAAMRAVPRECFVPESEVLRAHADMALPIACGQTISQPFIVALMTDLLEVEPEHEVLEVGTGSGYQAAVLSRLARRVYGIEIHEHLARTARERLARQGCDNVEVRCADGYHGWPEHAPFARILVTAAAQGVPVPLLEQLAPHGRLVMPLARGAAAQVLTLVVKEPDGAIRERDVLSVVFVPFTRR